MVSDAKQLFITVECKQSQVTCEDNYMLKKQKLKLGKILKLSPSHDVIHCIQPKNKELYRGSKCSSDWLSQRKDIFLVIPLGFSE